MSFDLLAYARERRYRSRNLHDGRPVPPVRLARGGEHPRQTGYVGAADRIDAIVCRDGYVCYERNERIGWCVLARSCRGLRNRLRELRALPVLVKQEGDTEAAGDAPLELIDSVIQVLKPYRMASRPDARRLLKSKERPWRSRSRPKNERSGAGQYLRWGQTKNRA